MWDKIAAGFTNSAILNGDKQSTLAALFATAMQRNDLDRHGSLSVVFAFLEIDDVKLPWSLLPFLRPL